jgi:hypothetical protein
LSWYTTNYAVGAVCSLMAGLFVFYRGQTRATTRRTWCYLCLAISVWHLGRFIMELAESEVFASVAARVVYFGAIFIPTNYLRFILSLLDEDKGHLGIILKSYAIEIIQLLLLFSGLLVDGVTYYEHGRFYETPSTMYVVFFASWVVLPALGIIKLSLSYFRTDAVLRKNQFKYVLYSSAIGFVLGSTSFIPYVTMTIPPFLYIPNYLCSGSLSADGYRCCN